MSENTKTEAIKAMTKEELLDSSSVWDIFIAADPLEAAAIENQLLEMARKHHVVGAVKNLIKGARAKQAEETKKAEAAKNEQTALALQGTTSIIEMRDDWTNNEYGVYKVLSNGSFVIACTNPIEIRDRWEDLETQKVKVGLEFQRDGRTKYITVPRQTIADYHKILDLSNYGVGVTSETAKNLVQYFSIAECQMDPETIRSSLSRFGWIEHFEPTPDGPGPIKQRGFVPYSDNVRFITDGALSDLKEAVKGKFEEDPAHDWIKMYKDLRRRTKQHWEPQLCVSAALASVLIGPLNELPFLLNLWLPSGAGKTIDLKLAASVWGNPNKYVSDSDSTINALVAKAAILYDLPLMVDDFAKAARDSKQLSNLIYALSAGREKDRLNADSQLKGGKRWHGCTLATNEFPLADDVFKGGAINRILDMEGTQGDIFENPGEVLETINDTYGIFGESFIEHLKINTRSFDEIRQSMNLFFEQLKSEAEAAGRPLEDKQTRPLALILAVDKYVTDHLINDGVYLNGRELAKQLKSKEQVSDGARAYQAILDFIDSNRIKFIDLGSEGGASTSLNNGAFGYIENENTVHFIPEMFKKFMADSGRNVKSFCKWASEKGLLITRDGNMNSKCINKKTRRVYTIKLEYPTSLEELPGNIT